MPVRSFYLITRYVLRNFSGVLLWRTPARTGIVLVCLISVPGLIIAPVLPRSPISIRKCRHFIDWHLPSPLSLPPPAWAKQVFISVPLSQTGSNYEKFVNWNPAEANTTVFLRKFLSCQPGEIYFLHLEGPEASRLILSPELMWEEK